MEKSTRFAFSLLLKQGIVSSFCSLQSCCIIYSFCDRSFKCSGPSIAIERVIWAALKKGRRPLRSGIVI